MILDFYLIIFRIKMKPYYSLKKSQRIEVKKFIFKKIDKFRFNYLKPRGNKSILIITKALFFAQKKTFH